MGFTSDPPPPNYLRPLICGDRNVGLGVESMVKSQNPDFDSSCPVSSPRAGCAWEKKRRRHRSRPSPRGLPCLPGCPMIRGVGIDRQVFLGTLGKTWKHPFGANDCDSSSWYLAVTVLFNFDIRELTRAGLLVKIVLIFSGCSTAPIQELPAASGLGLLDRAWNQVGSRIDPSLEGRDDWIIRLPW